MYMYGSKKQADLREFHRGKGYGDGEICLVEAMVCKNRQRGETHDCDVEVQAVHVKHDDPEDPLDQPKIRGSTKSVLKSLKCLLFNKSRKRGVGRGGWIEEDVRFDMVTWCSGDFAHKYVRKWNF